MQILLEKSVNNLEACQIEENFKLKTPKQNGLNDFKGVNNCNNRILCYSKT